MLRIPCPYCGERDYTEFTYGGDANQARPADPERVSDAEWETFLYQRGNPAGEHIEYWQHSFGCRQWLKVVRDTVTHDIVTLAGQATQREEKA